jgi:hypothetical protein
MESKVEPSPENIKAKQQYLRELKALPPSAQFPFFPGGSDFLLLVQKCKESKLQ